MEQPREIIIKDRNVETAIKEGIAILGVNKENADIIVLDRGKRGFLGLGRRMAKVKIRMKAYGRKNEGKLINQKNDQLANGNQKGKVEDLIRIENNTIYLNELVEEKYPVIRAEENVSLYKGKKLINGPTVVTNDEEITIKVKDVEPGNRIDINISDDKLKVFLKITRQVGVRYKPVILPAPEKDVDILIGVEKIEEVFPDKIQPETVHNELKKLNICFGIKEAEIQKAIDNPGQEYLVAEGKPPEESIDGYIDYIFQLKFDKQNKWQDEDKIDYFSQNQINSVQQGEVLAVMYPAQRGKPGYDVFGEEIKVKEPKKVDWNIEDGVKIVEDKAVATRSGRPVIRNGKLLVNQVYFVKGDVDLKEGNIDFFGDVFISGSIKENFKVKATGIIKVGGSVYHALLDSDEGIFIRNNIVGSTVIAGSLSVYYKNCLSYLYQIMSLLEEMREAILQLKYHIDFKTKVLKKYGVRVLIQFLIDTKYHNITELINKLSNLGAGVDQEKVIKELQEVINNLREKINEKGLSNINDIEELMGLKQQVSMVYDIIKEIDLNQAIIQARYIQSSTVKSSGDILVTREGVFNSTLMAGGKVKLTGEPGVFRGGKVIAKNVFVKELGSPGGSLVEVTVPKDGQIRAQKVYPNVLIRIGDQSYKFNVEKKNISAHLADNGGLSLF